MFHNGFIYDYHFIIKELVKEFECLGENTEKYITFSVPIKKKIENKDLEITYKIKFIDSYRFMASSLSKLVDNLSEGIHNNKCSDCGSNLDYIKTTAEPSSLERILVQSDTLLLADVFENFRDMCLKEHELDPAHFLSLPGLA